MPTNTDRAELLFLCHRIPYPPNKGDKIRSYQIFNFLTRHYNVHLGTFVDDNDDWKYTEKLEQKCSSSLFLPLHPSLGRLRSLMGFFTGEALSIPYYRQKKMQDWVHNLWKSRKIGNIVVFSSAMAQYIAEDEFAEANRIVDFVDVDSDKWRQYAASKKALSAWLYRREAFKLEKFDISIANQVDASVFVSPQEVALFKSLPSAPGPKIHCMSNGVASEYFNRDDKRENPFPADVLPIVFTGAMDYWANIDAVSWFANEILPTIIDSLSDARFYIVGSRPAASVQQLASSFVTVTGNVPDIRPYMQHAQAIVAPVRIARGIQNKVLEAMSMEQPVVVTSKGLEGIVAEPEQEILVADSANDFAQATLAVLNRNFDNLGAKARKCIIRNHSWQASFERLDSLLTAN